MNNSDLVWRLVELLLQKENDLKQVALDQAKKDSKPNDQKQDEAQLAEKDNIALSLQLYYLFYYVGKFARTF